MTWIGSRVIMTDYGIDLECARPTIVPIILRHLQPACKSAKCNPPYHHDDGCYSGKYEPMETYPVCHSGTPGTSARPCQSSTRSCLYIICTHASSSMHMDGRYIRGSSAWWNARLSVRIRRTIIFGY